MVTEIISTLGKGFWAIAEIFGYRRERNAALQKPEIVANREAKDEAKERGKDVEAVSNAMKTGDSSEIQRRGSI